MALWKFLHLLGVAIFLGNNLITPFWKAMADRNRDSRVVAFAQRMVSLTDKIFTITGVTLLAMGGYVLAGSQPGMWSQSWLIWGHALFVASGLLWLFVLIPLQWKLGRMAREFADGSPIPDRYWSLNRMWSLVGSLSSLLPLVALWWMVVKG
ncbi:MAG: DUF2269 domain-containing protein [Fibrobacteres bacterium]|jgi:uncharacterized membrane protein|nr:DUF2269 domain-containing protein [Fibrobacterota bacterium]